MREAMPSIGMQKMDARQQRGLEIAAVFKITQKGKVWIVPSQTGNGTKYTVCPDDATPHRSCPDHEAGLTCKHIFAVRYVIQREFAFNSDGEQVAESVTVIQTAERKSYPQDWKAYNAAQTNEKAKFLELLGDLCDGVCEPESAKTGRPRLPLRDAIFAAAYKVYSTVSARRFMTDLREAHEQGMISKAPHFNSVLNALENPALTPILRSMIAESSRPLKAIESDFAVDSSGFMTSRITRWFDHKYGKPRFQHDWVKVHIMVGVKTNVVTAVEIHDKSAQDSPQLPALLSKTAETFKIAEVSGDKAYGSYSNYDAIEAQGAVPFIPFKSIHTGRGNGLWAKMFHYFNFKREEFGQHYHKRSNVESTFSSIKRKFGDFVRSKTDEAMVNEALCKILCHNICVLIQESYELGISTTFWAENSPAQQLA
jgi:transposase